MKNILISIIKFNSFITNKYIILITLKKIYLAVNKIIDQNYNYFIDNLFDNNKVL